jgi:1-acyl-sn-glycerol-3-phosphate acyltransferase
MLAGALGSVITTFARLLTGAQPRWIGCRPDDGERIYFANHASHADFVLIWSSLPPRLRLRTRPVAGGDYWDKGALRRFIIRDVFNAVLVDREAGTRQDDPIGRMAQALAEGSSLILFPEGTRNTTEQRLLPFKSGIFHLASRRPDVELVPVWIENLNRVLPKGEVVPLPLLCTVNFGAPLRIAPDEAKADFVGRARSALLALAEQCTAHPE